ncbi:YczE/YyaS/YitT family protein [Eubacterium sp.]|uniref:YczE/YyaS/YitT family protein n=1 Tax=Eubacterium sp. TaxID=142586 RepID=UPI003F0CF2DE
MKKFEKEAYGYIKDMFAQHNMVKRIFLTIISIIVMGFGIALFNVSGFGVDPFTSMNMNVSSTLGIGYGTYQLIVNAVIIVFVVIFAHRGLIGVGTAINMIGVGYSCELFSSLIAPMIGDNIIVRICLLAAGIIVLCFSCSLFFVSNIGVGPYDSVGFMISNATKIHYKWVRVMTDIAVIIIGLVVSGGFTALMRGDLSGVKNIGIGTIITAFMMGPLVNFFSKHVSSKILDVNYADLSRDVAFFMIKGAMVKNRVPDDHDPARLNINSPEYNVINDGELKEI